MGLELGQLAQELASRKPGNEQLPGVDADGAMLTGMVDLEDSVAGTYFAPGMADQFHEAQRST
jgi:hypothetical protein